MADIETIRTLSFSLEKTDKPLILSYHTLSIPLRWEEMINELTESASQVSKYPYPIRSALNQLLIALFPQLIRVSKLKANEIWIYSREIIGPDLLKMVFRTWLRAEYERLKVTFPTEVNNEIFETAIEWKSVYRNLLEGFPDEWDSDYFHLLPELLGECISEPGLNLEFKSNSLSFRRAPDQTGKGGCELISWTPEIYKGSAYSIYLRFTLQTIPFQSLPVIHLNMGVKRWVSRHNARIGGKEHSVYLLTEFPGKNVTTHSRRFQIASVGWERIGSDFKLTWHTLLPQLFKHIHPSNTLPAAEELRLNPLNYIEGNGLQAAISFYQVTMPAWQHDVSVGLAPLDKRILSEQISSKLYDSYGLMYSEAPKRSEATVQNKKNIFLLPELPDKKEEEQNKQNRRNAIAQSIGSKELRLEIWYQSEMITDELFKSVADAFGFEILKNYDLSEGYQFSSEELSVQIQFYALGDLAEPLDCVDKTKKEQARAFRTRVDNVSGTIEPALIGNKKAVVGALVELLGRGDFDSHKDPKDAIRTGFSKSYRFTQFITPDENNIKKRDEISLKNQEETNLKHRAKMATLDLLRQLGVLSRLPSYSKKTFKKPVDYAAFWVCNPSGSKYMLPMFLHISGETREIKATAFGLGEFLPYREFLLNLGVIDKSKAIFGNDKQKVAVLLKNWLDEVHSGADLLMMAHAQNARNHWGWLANPNMTQDKVSFGSDRGINMSDLEGLRIVRVRDSEQNETPEFYAYREFEDGKVNEDKVSFTQGLFKLSDRTYFSIGTKPKQLSKINRFASRAINPGGQSWNPQIIELTAACLQPGDDSRFWAMLTHRLRYSALHFDGSLSLPLPLHLLKTASDEYARLGLLSLDKI